MGRILAPKLHLLHKEISDEMRDILTYYPSLKEDNIAWFIENKVIVVKLMDRIDGVKGMVVTDAKYKKS